MKYEYTREWIVATAFAFCYFQQFSLGRSKDEPETKNNLEKWVKSQNKLLSKTKEQDAEGTKFENHTSDVHRN